MTFQFEGNMCLHNYLYYTKNIFYTFYQWKVLDIENIYKFQELIQEVYNFFVVVWDNPATIYIDLKGMDKSLSEHIEVGTIKSDTVQFNNTMLKTN